MFHHIKFNTLIYLSSFLLKFAINKRVFIYSRTNLYFTVTYETSFVMK